jgi:hypothetical protein
MMGRNKTGGIRVRPTVPRGTATSDPMDQPIDEAGAAAREAAADEAFNEESGREPGED